MYQNKERMITTFQAMDNNHTFSIRLDSEIPQLERGVMIWETADLSIKRVTKTLETNIYLRLTKLDQNDRRRYV